MPEHNTESKVQQVLIAANREFSGTDGEEDSGGDWTEVERAKHCLNHGLLGLRDYSD